MKKVKRPAEAGTVPPRHVGLACAMLVMAALCAYVLYSAMETFYAGSNILDGWSAFEPDPVERGFLFWFSGLALIATLGLTVGLSLLLPARKPASNASAMARSTKYFLAVAALAAALGVKFFVLHNSPTMDDENVYRLSAELLLHGKLSVPAPATMPVEFYSGRWGVTARNGGLYPMYPHGWPAILALGYGMHAPWLHAPLVFMGIVLLGVDF